MQLIKNTRIIVILGYCLLMILAISGVVAIYLEMGKASDISKDPDLKQKLVELNNTLNNLYQAEGTAVIMIDANDQNLYFEYDSLMALVFGQIDSMKRAEENPLILSDLDSLTILLVKKADNLREMVYLMSQMENNTIHEITNTTITTFSDTAKLNDLLINRVQSIQDTLKTIVEKKSILQRIREVVKPGETDTLTQIKTGTVSYTDELAAPSISDTLVQFIKEKSLVAQKKNAKIIKALIERQNEFHLINGLTGTKIDQIVNKIKNAEYQYSLDILNRRNESLVKSLNLVVTIGLLALAVTIFFMSWTLKSVNEGINYRKKLQETKKSVDKLLVSREQLIYTITHDIKAPISSIIGFLDLLSGEKISREQQYFVKNMYSSATHILDLVKNLLDFQALEKNRQKINLLSFSPHSFVNDIYDSFRPLAQKKNLTFKLNSTIREEKKYTGDPYRIKQILNNLISNAIKFTPENGKITLRASIEKGNLFRISVKDSGPGISGEDKKRIFEEFTRLDKTRQTVEGTGLGLTISKKLSSLMNGNIEIKSENGRGADFILTIPLTPDKIEVVPPENESITTPTASSGKNIRILFVDDDIVQLNLLSELMKRAGLSYVCSVSAPDALNLLEKESFDIIFTDIQMPDIKGFELAEKIRKQPYPKAQTIPVIGLSADSNWKENHSKNGFTDFLSKPFKAEDILKIIEKYTGQTVNLDKNSFKTFNLSNLENLLESVSGDREAALNMVDMFIEESKNNLKLLGDALDKKDSETIKQISHKMGSLMSMMPSPKIVSILNLFEKGEQSEEKRVTLYRLLAQQSKEMKALRNTLINL
ncbi:hybrid sensor histidine kinase/response regulator [Bacteroidia bacterium]|nr:hybrid sensor histidine kinase/response regulator [Bacteroidia bacterium]